MTNPDNPINTGCFSIRIDDIMMDCNDAQKLGSFYASLLGWNYTGLSKDCVMVNSPDCSIRFLCHHEKDYLPPIWPEVAGAQQKMLHLDFTVSDLENAVLYAISLGATVAETQYNPKQWITMFDPAGHPFCLCLPEA